MFPLWRIRLLIPLLLPVTVSAQGFGQDGLDGFDDEPPKMEQSDVLSGFDDDSLENALHPEEDKAEKDCGALTIDGWAKLGSSWNFAHRAPAEETTDWRGLSRLRSELLLETTVELPASCHVLASGKGSYDLAYSINGRANYSSQVLDEYESELELRDTYLSGSPNKHLDLKLGRQIVVWGRSDNLRVTDIVNPLDQREPGLTDIEDLRLPTGMARLDSYLGPWNLSALIIPEIRFNKAPVFGHDFYPAQTPLPLEKTPHDGLANAEYGLALNGIFSRWDISLYWADYFDDTAHYTTDASGTTILEHSRLEMAGAAGNYTVGDSLLFVETAYFSGLEFLATPDKDFSRIDCLLGWEYSGWTDTSFSIEAVQRYLLDYSAELDDTPENVEKREFQWALRLQHDFMHQRLTLSWLALFDGENGGGGRMQRFQADYELAEALELTSGVLLYHSGKSNGFQNIGDNDRIFLELKYNF